LPPARRATPALAQWPARNGNDAVRDDEVKTDLTAKRIFNWSAIAVEVGHLMRRSPVPARSQRLLARFLELECGRRRTRRSALRPE
jgi:hypothetical protein